MRVDANDLVWAIFDLAKDSKIIQGFESRNKALRLAGNMVGNMSYANPAGDIYLFGRGDGNTEVIVRQMPRATLLNEDVIIMP